MPTERTIGIIGLRLSLRVETSPLSGIIPHPCHVLPIAPVAARVIVDEQVLEPTGAHSPIKTEIMHQIARHILPTPVTHPAGGGQFTHVRVDEGLPGAAFAPSGEAAVIVIAFH